MPLTPALLLLLVAGGALGTLARYGTSLLTLRLLAGTSAAAFPFATLAVNVLGCFLLAFVTETVAGGQLSTEARLVLGTGFLGAFTTFSTFALDADGLARQGNWWLAGVYVLLNVGLGLLAIGAGRAAAARLFGLSG